MQGSPAWNCTAWKMNQPAISISVCLLKWNMHYTHHCPTQLQTVKQYYYGKWFTIENVISTRFALNAIWCVRHPSSRRIPAPSDSGRRQQQPALNTNRASTDDTYTAYCTHLEWKKKKKKVKVNRNNYGDKLAENMHTQRHLSQQLGVLLASMWPCRINNFPHPSIALTSSN